MTEEIPKANCEEEKRKLDRLFEQAKYAYEEEKERRDTLNQMTKMYLWTMVAAAGLGVLKLGSVEKISKFLGEVSQFGSLGYIFSIVGKPLLLISIILFLVAFVLTTLAVKMRKRERLCNLEDFVEKVRPLETEVQLLSAIVANFVVATERNFQINEKKAYLLSLGMSFFLGAIFILSLLMLTTLFFVI